MLEEALMPYEFKTTQQVEFSDTDMAGIMHFANFFRFMEVTEHAFLRSLGLSVHMEEDGRTIGWPRVRAASCSTPAPTWPSRRPWCGSRATSISGHPT